MNSNIWLRDPDTLSLFSLGLLFPYEHPENVLWHLEGHF